MGERVRALGLLTLVLLPATAPLFAGPDDVLIHPVTSLVGERDFGRRFQIGFQVDF